MVGFPVSTAISTKDGDGLGYTLPCRYAIQNATMAASNRKQPRRSPGTVLPVNVRASILEETYNLHTIRRTYTVADSETIQLA
jgi:hypothetical protein